MKKHYTSSQIIVYGFLGVILFGTFLLMLPVSSKEGQTTPFLEALFTATSSVCVTGLVIHDTATYWSSFGQLIILIMIQIGGMGVVTMAVAIAIFSGKKISLRQRSVMQESISAHRVGGIVRMTGFILKMTLVFELIGALLMLPAFYEEFGLIKGMGYSLFHSISAFCNAGFDLMGVKGAFSSLSSFVNNPIINIVVPSLIIIGGIGFVTWEDLSVHKLHFHKYRMQSKIILCTTALLILLPALYFFFFEFESMPFEQRLMASFFQAVTPRTAGFNTVDLTLLSESGAAVMIVLMLIGGSPGSTAGGMKTTTFAVLMSTAVSVFLHRENAHFFKRRIADETIKNAATIFVMYLFLFFGSACLISAIEKLPLLSCMFETASAIGTVGLTLGITSQLSSISWMILIVLMFFGRVGGLTLIFATLHHHAHYVSKYPQEKLTVG